MYFKSVKIITTFFLLWITTQFQIDIENFLAYVFILSLGILHGSNDIRLIQKFQSNNVYRFKNVLFYYIAIIFISVTLFVILPKLALLVFLVFSAYHFGEQHLSGKLVGNSKLRPLFFCTYGFVIFLLIFYTNSESTSLVIGDMSGIQLKQIDFYFGLLVSLGLLILCMLILFSRKEININIFEEILYLGLFYITFSNATLLWSFAIYFIVWHAFPSLLDQIKVLYGKVSKLSLKRYLKSSILYWIVAILGIYLLYKFTNGNERLFNQLFFSFIAAVTFPHVLVMGKMFRGIENNSAKSD